MWQPWITTHQRSSRGAWRSSVRIVIRSRSERDGPRPARGQGHPRPAAAPPEGGGRSAPRPAGPGPRARGEGGESPPPVPPPLPSLDPVAKGAWAALFGGPGYLLLATMVGWAIPGWTAFLAVAALVGRFAALVIRLGARPPRASGPDARAATWRPRPTAARSAG